MLKKCLAAIALCFAVYTPAAASTYIAGHALCVYASSTAAVSAQDCGGVPLLLANNLSDLSDIVAARSNLGLIIGTNIQAHSVNLDAVAAATYTGVNTITTLGTITTGTWHGTAIGDTWISSASTWNAKLGTADIGVTVQAHDTDLDALAVLTSSVGLLKRTGAGTFGLAVSGTDFAPATSGSSLLLGNGGGGFSAFAGASPSACSPGFLRNQTQSAAGVLTNTCASVANADLTNSAVTLNGHSLSLGGTLSLVSTDLTDTTPQSFTPVLSGSTTAGTNTYTVQIGSYSVNNKTLSFSLKIQTTALDAAMAGNLQICGLPIAIGGNSAMRYAWALSESNLVHSGVAYTQWGGTGSANGGASTCIIIQEIDGMGAASGALSAPVTDTSASGGAVTIVITGFYFLN